MEEERGVVLSFGSPTSPSLGSSVGLESIPRGWCRESVEEGLGARSSPSECSTTRNEGKGSLRRRAQPLPLPSLRSSASSASTSLPFRTTPLTRLTLLLAYNPSTHPSLLPPTSSILQSKARANGPRKRRGERERGESGERDLRLSDSFKLRHGG